MRYRYKYCNQCRHRHIQYGKRKPKDTCNACVYDRKKFHEYSNYSHYDYGYKGTCEEACETARRCSARSIGELRGY